MCHNGAPGPAYTAGMNTSPPLEKAGPAERFAQLLTAWTGSTTAFIAALAAILVWGATGSLFHYSDTWQLVINTSTTIITFLMVFLIQRAQNKDSLALHLKLNELIAAVQGASNRLVNVEDMGEDELRALHAHYARLAELSRHDRTLLQSHSIDEAVHRHHRKASARRLAAAEAAVDLAAAATTTSTT